MRVVSSIYIYIWCLFCACFLFSLFSCLSSLFSPLLCVYMSKNKQTEDDETLRMNSKKYSRQECESIASHLMHLNQLPVQCMKYKEVALDLKRRDSDTTHGTAILS